MTKKVCTSTKPSGYSPYSDEASFYPPATFHGYQTSHSKIDESLALPGQGQDMENYFDGVEEVPNVNYEK